MNQRTIPLRDIEEERALFGSLDRNLHLLRRVFNVDAVSRGGVLTLSGEPSALDGATTAVIRALDLIRGTETVDGEVLENIFRGHGNNGGGAPNEGSRRLVEPRSPNQARYLESIENNVVTFGIGPAGTGKSFLAVAMALSFLKSGAYRRIVLCRPAVEAGESLGFLPGDLAAKVNPYLRPLYDALYELQPPTQVQRYIEEEVIEVLPLAYMRGRTLDRSIVILDEAQNCTKGQMKMALTRLGRESKIIVTGDITQVDLPQRESSGLVNARRILGGIEGVSFVYLGKSDIVRHPVIADIVRAYAREDEHERNENDRRPAPRSEPDAAKAKRKRSGGGRE